MCVYILTLIAQHIFSTEPNDLNHDTASVRDLPITVT